MSYFFNEAARVEHLEHVAYYEACQIGLGALLCRIVGSDIEVLVVAAHRRRSGYWLGRL